MSAAPLQLDFRAPARPRWRWLGWALLLASAAVALVFSEHLSEATRQHAKAQGHHDTLSERLRDKAPRRATAAPDAQTLAEVQRANRIIDQLTVPWDELFNAPPPPTAACASPARRAP